MNFNRQLFKEAFKSGYKKALSISRLKNWKSLNEWWYSNSTLYNKESVKITSKWLEEVDKIRKKLEKQATFSGQDVSSKRNHDYLLKYITSCVQNPMFKNIPIRLRYPVRGVLIEGSVLPQC